MEDIVASAEEAIKKLVRKDNKGKDVIGLKTNQIRKFLTAVTSLTNKIDVYKLKNGQTDELSEDLANEVKFLKVKIAYQVGRDDKFGNVKKFADAANLVNRIDMIGTSIRRFESFARYMEALVAYHKFYGGKDN